jgi:hypothetical protein
MMCDRFISNENQTTKSEEVRVIVFNTTFNNISVISWQSVLLVEETGGPGETHRPGYLFSVDKNYKWMLTFYITSLGKLISNEIINARMWQAQNKQPMWQNKLLGIM